MTLTPTARASGAALAGLAALSAAAYVAHAGRDARALSELAREPLPTFARTAAPISDGPQPAPAPVPAEEDMSDAEAAALAELLGEPEPEPEPALDPSPRLAIEVQPAGPQRQEMPQDSAEQTHVFRRENVLGTSFTLSLVGCSRAQAEQAEQAALAEVTRLEKLLSTWDEASEISRVNGLPLAEREGVEISADLGEVLRLSLLWRTLTRGAFDPYVGELHDLWRAAAKAGHEPAAQDLARLAAATKQSRGFKLSRGAKKTLTCTRAGSFDLDGIAKGYIVNRALEAALGVVPKSEGILLEIGGDLRVRGNCQPGLRAPWVINVADPRDPADNAEPLARLALQGGAVASSGGYARNLKVGKRTRSHILDPRTSQPVEEVLGATVVAKDAATADALATALCVLGPAEGLKLAVRVKAQCAIVDRLGKVHTSPGWAGLLAREGGSLEPWPEGFRAEITFRQVVEGGGRFKRHGTAVWVEDAQGKRVRILAVWLSRRELKWIKDLPTFWKEAWLAAGGKDDPDAISAWSRASRSPGQYTLAWDGKDEQGQACPQGRYRLRIDLNREHGPNREEPSSVTIELECGAKPSQGRGEDQLELKDVSARYGPLQRGE